MTTATNLGTQRELFMDRFLIDRLANTSLRLHEPVSGEKHTAMVDPAGPKRLVFWGSSDGFTFRKLDPQPDVFPCAACVCRASRLAGQPVRLRFVMKDADLFALKFG